MKKAILITFLIATSMVYSNKALAQEVEEDISPSPEQYYAGVPAAIYDYGLLHDHMTTRRVRFLQDCTAKLTSDCGMEITKGLIKDDDTVSEDCCKDILKMGRECHQGLMNFVFSTYELKDLANEILPRSKKIWNQCVVTIGASIGAPIAYES
ncbi:unnamed protein product [Cochlearia groenlandica]